LEPLLFLAHRIPFPPNKGDKVRSYHLLEYLSERYRVFLGSFVDQAEDWQYVPTVRAYCADTYFGSIHPLRARMKSLSGLVRGEALTLPYYRDAGLRDWIRDVLDSHGIRKAVVFSGAMAQYVVDDARLCKVVDFCDVDSAKWTQYAESRGWPMSWLYRREGERLHAFERQAAESSAASVFVTPAEVELFRRITPGVSARLIHVGNGVDASYFSPAHDLPSPFPAGQVPIVFTGAMDYWPNADAAVWFGNEVLPVVRRNIPNAEFWIVGMNPTPTVRALAGTEGVVVTGTVPDVRPYLLHASVVVAPLRVARGVQNKVLEAMAMGKAVVASSACAGGLTGAAGAQFEVAATAQEFSAKVLELIGTTRSAEIGKAAREHVLEAYTWAGNLAAIHALLEQGEPNGQPDRSAG
jgi:sugar transferase (PEP-CTERM/EpsH1 system associated)